MVADPIHVLLIEDNPGDARLVIESLRNTPSSAFNLTQTDHLARGIEILAQGGVDVILLDLSLPDSQGFETILSVFQHAPAIPLVVLTGQDDDVLAVRAVQAGAQDYVPKSAIDSSLLARTIRYAIERKRAEQDLRASEALYQSLVDVLPQSLCRKDLAGRFTFANRRFCQELNLSLAELQGKTDYDIHPPDLAEKYRQDDRQVIETGQLFETVEVRQLLGGVPIFTQTVKAPVRAADGQIVGVQIIFWDVTERHLAEAVRARYTQTLAALYQTSLEVNSQPDLPTLLQALVRRATALINVRQGVVYLMRPDNQSLEIVVGQAIPAGLIGFSQALGEGLVGRAAQTGQPQIILDYQNWPERLSIDFGSQVQRRLAVPLKIGQRVIGVIDVFDDQVGEFSDEQIQLVSLFGEQAAIAIENARLQEQIERHAEELEQRVADRTRELQKANERLTELDRLKDDFVSRISHELRTPLTSIKIYLELLQASKPEKREKYLATLTREADRLHRLIEDLLKVSQLALGDDTLTITTVDLNQLAAELVTDRMALAIQRNLTVVYTAAPVLPLIRTDARLATQALSHVLLNAIHYTPSGGHIDVSTAYAAADDHEWIMVIVADTGPGITAEDRPHIFERFYRGAAARDYVVPGMGLGLAFCHEIMAKLNGRITLDSEPGQGTTFTLWLHR